MPAVCASDQQDLAYAYDLGRVHSGIRPFEGRVFQFETDKGKFAVRDHGRVRGEYLDGPHHSHADVEKALQWELRCSAAGAWLAEPMVTEESDATIFFDGPASLFSDFEEGVRVVSVKRWVEGTHPQVRNTQDARRVGSAIGESVARFHQVGLNQAGGADVDVEYEYPAWSDLKIAALYVGGDAFSRVERLRPALERSEQVMSEGVVSNVGTVLHGDLHTKNVIMARADRNAYLIDFDLIWASYGSAVKEITRLSSGFGDTFEGAPAGAVSQFELSANTSYLQTMRASDIDVEGFAAAMLYPRATALAEAVTSEEFSPADFKAAVRSCEVNAAVLSAARRIAKAPALEQGNSLGGPGLQF